MCMCIFDFVFGTGASFFVTSKADYNLSSPTKSNGLLVAQQPIRIYDLLCNLINIMNLSAISILNKSNTVTKIGKKLVFYVQYRVISLKTMR